MAAKTAATALAGVKAEDCMPEAIEPWTPMRSSESTSAALCLDLSAVASMATAGSANFVEAHHTRGGLR